MDRAVDVLHARADFEQVSDVELAGRDVRAAAGRLRRAHARRPAAARRRALELTEYLRRAAGRCPPTRAATIAGSSTSRSSCRDMDRAYARLRAARRRARLDRAAAAAGLEPERRRHPGVLLPRSRRPLPRDPAVSARQGRCAMAPRRRSAVPRHRPHRDRRRRHRRSAALLSRHARPARRRRERELRPRAGAPEQRVRRAAAITTLRAPTGPGVELLEYLAPRDGRPAPPDLKANDIAHWHSTIVTRGAAAALASQFGGWLVSPVVLPIDSRSGFARGLMMRDPDGHGVQLVERE